MRLVTGSIAAALLAVCSEGSRISLLKSKKNGYQLRRDKPLVTKVNAFETAPSACCACFKSKYAWPANAGLGAAFAPQQTCDTCYVTDIYGIDAKSAVVLDVPRPPMDAGAAAPAAGSGPGCTDLCDTIPNHSGCMVTKVSDGETYQAPYFGPGACKGLIADSVLISQVGPVCDNPMFFDICPTACGKAGCGAEAAYDKTESKVEAVHEWNWNCASGNAPEDAMKWMTGPVEGEPESTRAPFLMCKEDDGWYCPFDDGPDLQMAPAAETPTEIDEGGSGVISVQTMSLPVIDAAKSVAESVTP